MAQNETHAFRVAQGAQGPLQLAEDIDEFSGKEDVRSKEGAYGVLSRNIYTRSQAFESALINAMLPFLHHTYYGDNHGTE